MGKPTGFLEFRREGIAQRSPAERVDWEESHPDGRFLSAAGRNVVVIGGGETGTDCVETAVRHGAAGVVQLEILGRPPDRRAPDNPWPQWPRLYKLDSGQEEAAALQGVDPRRYSVQPKRFVGDAEGRDREVHIVDVEWRKGPDGRTQVHEIPETERVIPAELVLLALGFLGPKRPGMVQELGIKLDEGGNVVTDA